MMVETLDADTHLERLIHEYDQTSMPIPDIECDPHLLISKVRKHYMEYVIKLLALNYETNQRLVNKDIYLPSAIWRCAKSIETTAAQTCMVAQLYRKNIIPMINELKRDTKKGRLNKKLLDCLTKPPKNDKSSQTSNNTNDCICGCQCNKRKRLRKSSRSPKYINKSETSVNINTVNNIHENNIDFMVTTNTELPSNILNNKDNSTLKHDGNSADDSKDTDEVMLQLKNIFQGVMSDDDLFDTTLCDDSNMVFDSKTLNTAPEQQIEKGNYKDTVIENHSAQIKSLDERLASLAGLLVNNNDPTPTTTNTSKPEPVKPVKRNNSKWLCEEYFLKAKLFELLDQMRDENRNKYARMKLKLRALFGEDSDDEGVISPLDETPEFIISCKERIAPWIVKLLTPSYIKGHIKGKVLFKSVAKHLLKLIYQCSRYPNEYEVYSFVTDFLENHKLIRCEADFKQFQIENL